MANLLTLRDIYWSSRHYSYNYTRMVIVGNKAIAGGKFFCFVV